VISHERGKDRERTGKCLRQVEHIRGHSLRWFESIIAVNNPILIFGDQIPK
jgi:hypothetical protein